MLLRTPTKAARRTRAKPDATRPGRLTRNGRTTSRWPTAVKRCAKYIGGVNGLPGTCSATRARRYCYMLPGRDGLKRRARVRPGATFDWIMFCFRSVHAARRRWRSFRPLRRVPRPARFARNAFTDRSALFHINIDIRVRHMQSFARDRPPNPMFTYITTRAHVCICVCVCVCCARARVCVHFKLWTRMRPREYRVRRFSGSLSMNGGGFPPTPPCHEPASVSTDRWTLVAPPYWVSHELCLKPSSPPTLSPRT